MLISGVSISAQYLIKISLDRTSVGFFLSLGKRKSRSSMLVRFFSSPPSDFVLYNILKWIKSASCFQWQSGPAASLSGAGAWWSLVQHMRCFCIVTATALLLWQLCTPQSVFGSRVMLLLWRSALCMRLPGLNACFRLTCLWEIEHTSSPVQQFTLKPRKRMNHKVAKVEASSCCTPCKFIPSPSSKK